MRGKAAMFIVGAGAVLSLNCSSSEARGAANFTLAVDAPREATIGQQARTILRLLPKGPYHVNTQYPTALIIAPPAGVEMPKTRLVAADGRVSEQEARFEIVFVPKEAGAKVFAADFKFSVCTAKACDIKKEKISWTTTVR